MFVMAPELSFLTASCCSAQGQGRFGPAQGCRPGGFTAGQQQGLAGTSAGSGSTGIKGCVSLPGRLVHMAEAEDAGIYFMSWPQLNPSLNPSKLQAKAP